MGEVAGTTPANEGDILMEQLALTVAEACAAAKVGKTVLYEAIANGTLVARKRGRRTLVLPADLRNWVEQLPAVETKITDKMNANTQSIARARPR